MGVSRSCECCILGAGPAGLGAALELTKHGVSDILIVDRNKTVGGLARTEVHGGARFDLGPHRFVTKSKEINKIWLDTLGSDFRLVSRLTRIFYRNKYFRYPVKPLDVLAKLGPVESLNVMFSFVISQMKRKEKAISFEDWMVQRFGRKLYEIFFKTYTEKVWGIPCSQIGAEWAAQRIKGLDILEVLRNALLGGKSNRIKSLVEEFHFPVLGAGQMYEAMCDNIVSQGAELMLGSTVVRVSRQDSIIVAIDVRDPDSKVTSITAKHFFSSIPLKGLFNMLDPPESSQVKRSIEALRYRDHITVDLLVNGENLFPDQWLYIHTPHVQMARLVNYNNFSDAMVDAKNKSALSIEYFTFQNGGLWNRSDDSLRDLALTELDRIGLVKKKSVERSWVVREPEAYPMTYIGFQPHYDLLKSRIDEFTNLQPIGRAGMHKYNNQDHSIMSGILAARNYLRLPGSPYNLWDINVDAEYHETIERPSH